MKNKIDERQQSVLGRIMNQAVIGLLFVLLCLGFLDDFEIFSILNYIEFSDLCINLVILSLAYISVCLIMKDAYFGLFSDFQRLFCRTIFTFLSIVIDILIVFDFIRGDGFSPTSFSSILMSNSIAISLWIKSKKND